MILARPFRLLLLFVLFVLVPLGLRPMWIPDESRYAEIAREMLESGNWVVPTLLGMHYFEKPVAGYWFTAFSQAVLGENLFASRLPAALATGLSAIVAGACWPTACGMTRARPGSPSLSISRSRWFPAWRCTSRSTRNWPSG